MVVLWCCRHATRRWIVMNADPRTRHGQQLSTLEQALISRLRFLLPDSATPGSSLFTSREYCPTSGLIYFVPPARVDLCAIASDCIWLRKRMSLPTTNTIAQLFLEACSGTAGADDAQHVLADLLLAAPPVAQSHEGNAARVT